MFAEDQYIQLSGIQHFIFCRRQWALIHIEQQWAENYRTVDGELFHENAHDTDFRESRGDLFITRGVYIHSARLGVSGQCDVLEYRRAKGGITLFGKEGEWLPYPVEYKRGEPNAESGDTLQLCAEAMCLEEMLCCHIPEGALFYGKTRRRVKVAFTEELREQVEKGFAEMHDLMRRGYTPKVKPKSSCNACSLRDICLPKLCQKQKVADYLAERTEDI